MGFSLTISVDSSTFPVSDLISAADVRICSPSAVFSVREVQLGLAADIGTVRSGTVLEANSHSLVSKLFVACKPKTLIFNIFALHFNSIS